MSAIESSRERVEDVPVASRAPISFEVFFESERVRLHRVLFAITGSRQEAEDISQEAFLGVWERWDRVGVLDEPVGLPPSHGDERVPRSPAAARRLDPIDS